MTSYINKHLKDVKPYKVASHKIWAVSQEERSSILKLDWNEATCGPTPLVKERLLNLLSNDLLNLYPATYNAELYLKIAEYVGIPKENIQYFASSDALHEYISRLYIAVGDAVLLLWPSYDNFRLTMQVAGAEVSYYEIGNNFLFNPKAFENEIDRVRPKLVYICNPNNPTGLVLDRNYIENLLKKYKDTLFLVDEAYIEFDEGYSCKEFVLEYENLLISRTMSKAFGLANIRFGYLLASKENIKLISNIRNPKNITTFAQEAVIAALSDVEYMRSYVQEVIKARTFFIESINTRCYEKFKAYESHANFVMIECRNKQIKEKISNYLEDNNIFIRAISQSESVRNCIRITIGTIAQMKRVIKVFESFC